MKKLSGDSRVILRRMRFGPVVPQFESRELYEMLAMLGYCKSNNGEYSITMKGESELDNPGETLKD